MSKDDLEKIIANHNLWIESNHEHGEKADLRKADLCEADLRKADLRKADLSGALLSGANLRAANLSNANLRNALLDGANLRKAKGLIYLPCGGYEIIYTGRLIGLGYMWHTLDEWLAMPIEKVWEHDKEINADWFERLKGVLPSIPELYDLWQAL